MKRNLLSIPCAVCNKYEDFNVLYPERLDDCSLNFAARKEPKRVHFRIVECKECGLIYSNPIFQATKIENLYSESNFILEKQISNQAKTYGHYLMKAGALVNEKENLLEIGCGNGYFLEIAKEIGYKNVFGVEPSHEAIEKAKPDLKNAIVNDFFKRDLFKKEFFDVVCFFQTFDHILSPNDFLRDVHWILKKGGIVLAINHDIKSFLPRLLGEHSSMIDIEHIYLFDKSTMRKILKNNKFEVVYVKDILSIYSVDYFLKMSPIPVFLKKRLTTLATKLIDKSINFRGGNMVSVAKKI